MNDKLRQYFRGSLLLWLTSSMESLSNKDEAIGKYLVPNVKLKTNKLASNEIIFCLKVINAETKASSFFRMDHMLWPSALS